MVKQIINPDQANDNTFKVNAKDVCCESKVPESAAYAADFSGAVATLTSGSISFKRNADAETETISLENFPHTVTSMRVEIVNKLNSNGFNVSTKSAVDVTGTTVTITGELIPQVLTDNAGTDNFAAV